VNSHRPEYGTVNEFPHYKEVVLIRILLADNHHLTHPGFQTILSATKYLTLVGIARTAHELQQICKDVEPDLLLFSPNVSEEPVTDLMNKVRYHWPSIKALIMLANPQEICLRQLRAQGVGGAILKSDTPDELLQAIFTIAEDRPWFSTNLMPILLQPRSPLVEQVLTKREFVILRLLTEERTTAEIALALHIAERTVRCHLESIYGKLQVRSRVGAAVKAVRLNLIVE
jgi:DNA-binding NarL/FixJ family response regulator